MKTLSIISVLLLLQVGVLAQKTFKTVTRINTPILSEPHILADRIDTIPENTTINIQLYDGYIWVLTGDTYEGYVAKVFIETTSEMEEAVKQQVKKEQYDFYLKSNPDEVNLKRIKAHQIWLGMTKEEAILSIGKPNSINETVGTYGKHEQWVYDDRYLYFENGKLSSYQTSK